MEAKRRRRRVEGAGEEALLKFLAEIKGFLGHFQRLSPRELGHLFRGKVVYCTRDFSTSDCPLFALPVFLEKRGNSLALFPCLLPSYISCSSVSIKALLKMLFHSSANGRKKK